MHASRRPRGGIGAPGAPATAGLASRRPQRTHGPPERRKRAGVRARSTLPSPVALQPPASPQARTTPRRTGARSPRAAGAAAAARVHAASPRPCARCPPRRTTAPPAAVARHPPPAAAARRGCALARADRCTAFAGWRRLPVRRTPCGRHAASARACEGGAAAGWRRWFEIPSANHEQGRRRGGRGRARVRKRRRAGAVVAPAAARPTAAKGQRARAAIARVPHHQLGARRASPFCACLAENVLVAPLTAARGHVLGARCALAHGHRSRRWPRDAENATCGTEVHERVSARGPVNAGSAFKRHTKGLMCSHTVPDSTVGMRAHLLRERRDADLEVPIERHRTLRACAPSACGPNLRQRHQKA